jgi:hypothetical protein
VPSFLSDRKSKTEFENYDIDFLLFMAPLEDAILLLLGRNTSEDYERLTLPRRYAMD